MQLHGTLLSPFTRKVRVLAAERGLDLPLVAAEVGTHVPLAGPAQDALSALNPLIKIPVLIGVAGGPLYDSAVICAFLDELGPGPRLIPEGVARWPVLRLQALADGMVEAALLCRFEARRPPAQQDPDWIAAQQRRLRQGLDALEAEAAALAGPPHLGAIAAGCALGYLDFRFAGLAWREGRPALARWEAGMAARPAMQATRPPPASPAGNH